MVAGSEAQSVMSRNSYDPEIPVPRGASQRPDPGSKRKTFELTEEWLEDRITRYVAAALCAEGKRYGASEAAQWWAQAAELARLLRQKREGMK